MADTLFEPEVHKSATISACGKYRYTLLRRWDTAPSVCFVMLNPSTADGWVDDPTIRRCMGFARLWGFGGIVVVNLYAYRATNPKELWKVDDPVGPDNDQVLYQQTTSRHVIAAWGRNAKPARAKKVYELIHPLSLTIQALKLTEDGCPYHPLYLPNDSERVPFVAK